MIKDIEVIQWDYEVYMKREDGTPRLVRVFDSEKEAEKCCGMIFNLHEVSSYYVQKLKLEAIR